MNWRRRKWQCAHPWWRNAEFPHCAQPCSCRLWWTCTTLKTKCKFEAGVRVVGTHFVKWQILIVFLWIWNNNGQYFSRRLDLCAHTKERKGWRSLEVFLQNLGLSLDVSKPWRPLSIWANANMKTVNQIQPAAFTVVLKWKLKSDLAFQWPARFPVSKTK